MGEQSDLGPLEPIYTAAEIAAVLRVSTSTVLRLIAADQIEGAFKIGRGWRVPQAGRDAYFAHIGFTGRVNQIPAVLPLDEAPASPASAVPPTTAEAPTPTAA